MVSFLYHHFLFLYKYVPNCEKREKRETKETENREKREKKREKRENGFSIFV
jgi:hypothetical protein